MLADDERRRRRAREGQKDKDKDKEKEKERKRRSEGRRKSATRRATLRGSTILHVCDDGRKR
jgi:hypothetical protein